MPAFDDTAVYAKGEGDPWQNGNPRVRPLKISALEFSHLSPKSSFGIHHFISFGRNKVK
jgi:hypothetical protein